MVTGIEGCPGLSVLASCPEAALITLDTRAGEGGVWITRDNNESWPDVGIVEGSGSFCSIGQGQLPLEGHFLTLQTVL